MRKEILCRQTQDPIDAAYAFERLIRGGIQTHVALCDKAQDAGDRHWTSRWQAEDTPPLSPVRAGAACQLVGAESVGSLPAPTSAPFESRKDFLLVEGMNDRRSPNTDALFWVAGKVLPRMGSGLPNPPRTLAAVSRDCDPKRFSGAIHELLDELAGKRAGRQGAKPAAGKDLPEG